MLKPQTPTPKHQTPTQDRSHAVEHHFETQTLALSSETLAEFAPQLPLAFIGRVETLDADWRALIAVTNRRPGVAKIAYAAVGEVRRTGSETRGARTESEKRFLWQAVMTPEVRVTLGLAGWGLGFGDTGCE